jgi:hypothetical protein
MSILIFCIDDPSYEAQMGAGGALSFKPETGRFSMPCPMGDDWLQSVSYVAEPPPLFVRVIEKNTVAIFQQRTDACKFNDWLCQANTDVEEGFRNMRG